MSYRVTNIMWNNALQLATLDLLLGFHCYYICNQSIVVYYRHDKMQANNIIK